jgi:type III pantothenate kinase
VKAPARIVCDIGNSRIKWGRMSDDGQIDQRRSLPLDDVPSWRSLLSDWSLDPTAQLAIASVNPPAAKNVETTLDEYGSVHRHWYCRASDVPIRTLLPRPDLAGADRALAVLAALPFGDRGRPGLVVQCGSAITVERITSEGDWEGGSIGIGLGLAARTLHEKTAFLPEILPESPPPSWGDTTETALQAGLFWGIIGAVREMLARQDLPGSPHRWRVWTGGDAPRIAAIVEDDPKAHPIVLDLVLRGLATAAFGVR